MIRNNGWMKFRLTGGHEILYNPNTEISYTLSQKSCLPPKFRLPIATQKPLKSCLLFTKILSTNSTQISYEQH